MSVNTRKGPIFDPGICRCCGTIKKCRLLNVEYEWFGQKEVYSEMFVDCFGLMLCNLDGSEEERLVCATCVMRLRDASAFRRQVLLQEQLLLQANIQTHSHAIDIKVEVDMKEESRSHTASPSLEPVDNMHTDTDNDEQTETLQELKEKCAKASPKKQKKLTKVGVKRKIAREKEVEKKKGEEKKEMLINLKRMKEKLRELDEIDTLYNYELPLTPPTSRAIDKNPTKAFKNVLTIVENSYVCPFYTSFSDYYCIYCRTTFTDPDKLREHTLTHPPETLKEHMSKNKIAQIDITRIDCRLCQERINDIDSLKCHLSTVHDKFLYEDVSNEFLKFKLTCNNLTCTECEASFSFFHALRKHMAEHFGSWICDVCGAHYFDERMLLLHQKSHEKVEENFTCAECGKCFKSKHSRRLHVARAHRKEPAYQCYKCDAMLHSYSQRYRHMIDAHGEQRNFNCDHCDRSYDTRKSLREHVRRYHLKIFKHQCDLCEKRFYLPCRLKEHMATHTGERNFRCDFCGKSYPRMRGLKVHLQSHSADKKYKCLMCNASFTQNFNLKNHMKRQHQSLDLEEFHE